MAKVTTQEKHGSVGPSTFLTSTRYGTVERVRVHPRNPRTLPQQTHRSNVAAVVSAWRHHTEEERASWAALARQMGGRLTGYTTYVSVNITSVRCGLPQLRMAPPTPALGTLTCAGLAVTDTPLVKLVQVSATFAPDKFIVAACAPVSPGVEYVRKSLRVFAVLDGHAAPAADLDLTAAYLARFGAPRAGWRIVVQLTPMQNGFKGQPLQCSAIVTGAGE